MINVKVSDKEERENDYPKLMVDEYGMIVLFAGHKVGMVVETDSREDCGHYSESWDMSWFTEFDGSITLSNGSK